MQLDKRTREDILRQMEELARSYTPEWKFQAEHGDGGSALVNIYADMLTEMVRQYNQIPERDKQMFFQRLGVRQRAAAPAKGYVSFGMVNREVGGTLVPGGTGLVGTADSGEQVGLETDKEIYVSVSEIKKIYYQEGRRDAIYCLAEKEGSLEGGHVKNLQEHICWLGHSTVFHIGGEAELFITLVPLEGQDFSTLLQDGEKTEFSYLSGQGEWRFESWSCEGNTIRLKKTREMPDFASVDIHNQNSCYVKWRAKDIQAYKDLVIEKIGIGAVGEAAAPEYIYTADGQEAVGRFFPFGERPYSYGEFYLCSNEVLEKKGAAIEVVMDMEFRRILPLTEPVPMPVQWKKIMRKEDIPKEEAVPITIDEVVWEYYNGMGFTRLFPKAGYTDVFWSDGQESASPKVKLSFFCPRDIQPVMVHARMTYCIRARILKMNHEYTPNGYYRTPFVTHTELSYDYSSSMQEVENCVLCNNLEEHRVQKGSTFIPFSALGESRPALYIGFDTPLRGGPFGLYCGVKSKISSADGQKWNYEYYNGREWNSLALEDSTGNLTKSGILRLLGNYDFDACSLFGQRLFWMRFIELGENAEAGKVKNRNPIEELWMNTVPVTAVETVQEEFVMSAESEENPFIRLRQKNIQQIALWVDESYLSRAEQERLEKKTRVDRVRDGDGAIAGVWVLWKETEDISMSRWDERCYHIERREGILRFPSGKENLPAKVVYTWGGGSQGNLAEGQITHLNRSIRFLSQVANRHRLLGGKNQELPEEAVERMERQLLHRNRAVMSSDYEALALEAAGEVAKVRAFCNRNQAGERLRGAITLVVLKEDYPAVDFQALRDVIYDYIKCRMPGTAQLQKHFYIVEPWFTEIWVSAVCVIKENQSVFACRAEALERLSHFLNPLTGNFDKKGWGIGQAPRRGQIQNALSKTNGIDRIQKLSIKAYCHRDGRVQEIDLEGKLPEFMVVINGTHKLLLEFSQSGPERDDK